MLIDIYWNIEINEALRISHYISQLTGSIPFEKRTEDFKYYDVINDKDYMKRLYVHLSNLSIHRDKVDNKYKLFKESLFDFYEILEEEIEEIDLNDYMKYDDWWKQYEELYFKLETIVKNNTR